MKNTFIIILSLILLISCEADKKINPDITITLTFNQQELLSELAGGKTKRNIFLKTYENSIILLKEDSTQDFFHLFGKTFFNLHPNSSLSSVFDIKKEEKHETEIKELIALKNKAIEYQIRIIDKRFGMFFSEKITNIHYTKTNNGLVIDIEGEITKEELIKILNTKANLAFYHTYKNIEVGNQIFENVNKILSDSLYPGYRDSAEKNTTTNSKYFDSLTEITEDIDWDEYYGENATEKLETEIFRKTTPLSAYLFPYANADNQWIEGSVLGYAKLSDTAIINSYFNKDYVKAILPRRDLMFMWEGKSTINATEGEPLIMLYAIKKPILDIPLINNTDISSAVQGYNHISSSPMVSIQFNSKGTNIWAQMTEISAKENSGIALTLNGKVFSAPIASARIEGGSTQITGGSFAGEDGMQEAKDIANLINAVTIPILFEIKSIITHKKEDK